MKSMGYEKTYTCKGWESRDSPPTRFKTCVGGCAGTSCWNRGFGGCASFAEKAEKANKEERANKRKIIAESLFTATSRVFY